MRGKVHKYSREHINTDEIIPARYLNTDDKKVLAKHAMEDMDKTFVSNVKPGDFIVAGGDFGCGSSREHAVWALRGAGIIAVIAENFARIFFRNGVNNGFLCIECPGITEKVDDGDELDIDPWGGTITNLTKGEILTFKVLPDFVREIANAGGLLEYVRDSSS